MRIWKVPVSGGEAVQVTNRRGSLSIESADGADLYFVDSSGTDQPGPLMRMPVTGGTAVKVVENVMATSFEVLAGGIYYIEQAAGETSLDAIRFRQPPLHGCRWKSERVASRARCIPRRPGDSVLPRGFLG